MPCLNNSDDGRESVICIFRVCLRDWLGLHKRRTLKGQRIVECMLFCYTVDLAKE